VSPRAVMVRQTKLSWSIHDYDDVFVLRTCLSGNASYLYSRGVRFESRPGH
jgi:hypothetical protein